MLRALREQRRADENLMRLLQRKPVNAGLIDVVRARSSAYEIHEQRED